MFKVVKRDGEVADFDLQKIGCAIEKAFDATQMQYNKDMVDLLNLRVTADFQKKIKDDKIDVESIQDSVENVLVQAGYADVAKAYILYRKQREKNPQYEIYDPGLQRDRGQLCESRRLACKRKFYGYLFRRRSDPEQLGSGYGKLLAV